MTRLLGLGLIAIALSAQPQARPPRCPRTARRPTHQAGTRPTFSHFHHTAYSIAAVYSVLGDLDKAQEWIENAANDGFPCYTLFEADPNLQRLRATPRFQAFVANLRREYEHIPGETK